ERPGVMEGPPFGIVLAPQGGEVAPLDGVALVRPASLLSSAAGADDRERRLRRTGMEIRAVAVAVQPQADGAARRHLHESVQVAQGVGTLLGAAALAADRVMRHQAARAGRQPAQQSLQARGLVGTGVAAGLPRPD